MKTFRDDDDLCALGDLQLAGLGITLALGLIVFWVGSVCRGCLRWLATCGRCW
jgi:hypothetical protein